MDGEIVEIVDISSGLECRQKMRVKTITKALYPYPNPRDGYFVKMGDIEINPDNYIILKEIKK